MHDEFTAFFYEDFDRLVGFLCKAGYDREVARDAAAEAMGCLLENGADVISPKAWVRTVAYRIAARMVLEGRRSVKAAIEGCWSTTEQVDDHARCAVIDEQPQIVAMLRQLPDVQRVVMAWSLDGFEPTEIADQIGSTAVTVRSNLRHAKARLRQLYTEQMNQAAHTATTDPRRRRQ